jgi:N6-adenosine-specific RNA methylase IME4
VSAFTGLRDDYAVVVADPPWMYQKQPGTKGADIAARGAVDIHYDTMTNEQIRDLPVRHLAATDAHLFMWVTNPGIYGGRFSDVTPADIAAAWGFRFVTLITWVKTTRDGDVNRGGPGWYFRGCTEHILYAVRGKAGIPSELREPNVILAERGRHSEKPAEFFQLVDRIIPTGPRLEMFARAPRPGWDVWGDQADGQPPAARRSPGLDEFALFDLPTTESAA